MTNQPSDSERREALLAAVEEETTRCKACGMTNYLGQLRAKRPGDQLTVEELACALYEGTPHLQNLAETLARQHGQASALCFFDMTGASLRAFWIDIARQLIEHSSHWVANEGSGCLLDDAEAGRLAGLLPPVAFPTGSRRTFVPWGECPRLSKGAKDAEHD